MLTSEELTTEARLATRSGYMLAGARQARVLEFRWVLWSRAPITPLEVKHAFKAWKTRERAAVDLPENGRAVSIFGPWAKRRPAGYRLR